MHDGDLQSYAKTNSNKNSALNFTSTYFISFSLCLKPIGNIYGLMLSSAPPYSMSNNNFNRSICLFYVLRKKQTFIRELFGDVRRKTDSYFHCRARLEWFLSNLRRLKGKVSFIIWQKQVMDHFIDWLPRIVIDFIHQHWMNDVDTCFDIITYREYWKKVKKVQPASNTKA